MLVVQCTFVVTQKIVFIAREKKANDVQQSNGKLEKGLPVVGETRVGVNNFVTGISLQSDKLQCRQDAPNESLGERGVLLDASNIG